MNSSARFTRRSTLVLHFIIGLFFILSSGFALAQSLDENYTAKIKEYTTEPYFLTELVDHLPASATVPTPEKILGYVIGTPEKLTYTKDIYRYLRELEKASPRVKIFSMGQSEEGREMLLVVIADEKTIQQLDQYNRCRFISITRHLPQTKGRMI